MRHVFTKTGYPNEYAVLQLDMRDVPEAMIGYVRKEQVGWRTWSFRNAFGGPWESLPSGRTREDAALRLSALWSKTKGEINFRRNNPGPAIFTRTAEQIDRLIFRMEEDLRRIEYPYYISSLGDRAREAANRIRLAAKWEEEDARASA